MRRLLAILLLFTAATTVSAQEQNDLGLKIISEVTKFTKHSDLKDDGYAVRYFIQGATYKKLINYKFKFSIWREKDPNNPVYPDGIVKDWNRLEQLEFSVSKRFPNDYYIITSPELAEKEKYTRTKELVREANWRGAFTFFIYNEFFKNQKLDYDGVVNYYLRFEMTYVTEEGICWLTNDPNKNTRCIKWDYSKKEQKVQVKKEKLVVSTNLTERKVKNELEEEKGWNFTFSFPEHPENRKYELTMCFWREKDPTSPLYNDGIIKDFKQMDMMQFPISTSNPYDIGHRTFIENDDSWEMASEIYLERNNWDDFSIFLPVTLLENMEPRYELPENVEEQRVRYYITYSISSGNLWVSNEGTKLPWVEYRHFTVDMGYKEIKEGDKDDIGDLFGEDDPTPKHKHNLITKYGARMYKNINIKTIISEPRFPSRPHRHHLHATGTCSITPEYKIENPCDSFVFKAGDSRTVFGADIDNAFISRQPIKEGLWTAMFPEGDEMSRQHESSDTTTLRGINIEDANELVSRMNEKAEKDKMKWVFTVATATELQQAGHTYMPCDNGTEDAFTEDSCLYVVASPTEPRIAKKEVCRYLVEQERIVTCTDTDCDYGYTTKRKHHFFFEKFAQISCRWFDGWTYNINAGTKVQKEREEANPPKPIVTKQTNTIFFVEKYDYKKCSDPYCKYAEPGELLSVESFTSYEEARRTYMNYLIKFNHGFPTDNLP